MPDSSENESMDGTAFDGMSTESLQDILYRDSLTADSGDADMDTILHIMEVVARREKDSPNSHIPDADAALASFHKNYEPLARGGRSLYETDEPLAQNTSSSPDDPFKSSQSPRRTRKPKRFRRITSIAAAVFVVIFIGSVTAQALGLNLWGAIARWTSETFGLFTDRIAAQESGRAQQVPEQLQKLHNLLQENEVATARLPTYIPDRYAEFDTNMTENPGYTDFTCLLENEETSTYLIVQYRLHRDAPYTPLYEKDEASPDVYTHNGIDFYILTNMDAYCAVWSIGHLEGFISGAASRGELTVILDSIGE